MQRHRLMRAALFAAVALVIVLLLIAVQPRALAAARRGSSSDNTRGAAHTPDLPGPARATFVSLVRNDELWNMADSIRTIEDRFNRRHHYPWIFLNDVPFTDEFVNVTTALTSGKAVYGLVPHEHWSYPDWIDQDHAARTRQKMKDDNIIYGDSESYRHMCRFQSGFFFRHVLLEPFDYYWRVEPGIKLFCDIDYDVFSFMRDHNKTYGFTLTLHEFHSTIESLWDHVKNFTALYPDFLDPDNALAFVSDNHGDSYNLCHFWSNFEIGDLRLWRSEAYSAFFDYLDRVGKGFFYERWGDAPVHSIAASLFQPADRIHWFDDIGYSHPPFSHCPSRPELRKHCSCDPGSSLDWNGISCTRHWLKSNNLTAPD